MRVSWSWLGLLGLAIGPERVHVPISYMLWPQNGPYMSLSNSSRANVYVSSMDWLIYCSPPIYLYVSEYLMFMIIDTGILTIRTH